MELSQSGELKETPKRHKSLRGRLGLPITGVLQFTNYGGNVDNEGLGDSSDGMDEMIQVAKTMQDNIKKSGKTYEVYDVEPNELFEDDNVTLNKPTKGDVKKYKVYVKNPKTNKIVKVNFGDPNMEIKRDNPKKKKSFRARHKCDTAKDKTTPRYWSCKFWSTKPVKELISEIINPDEVDITTLKFNDELNPLLFDKNSKLKEEVRTQLLKIAIEFIKSCKIEEYKYNNIVLVGSMANYTYTPQSDIDIHIIIDFSQFKADEEFLGEYFDAKKDLWSTNHDIKINGHPVECYIQNFEEPYTSIGVYSLMKDDWIREPLKKIVTVDEANIQLKAAAFMNAIDKLEERFKNGDDISTDLTKIKNKIKNMRKNGLYKEGEYSTENLVFKVLRNNGYLQKVINLKNNNIDQNLSL